MPRPAPLPKLLVIVGPTASGKTALAERLARRFGGEIVSADSRTIYKGMDIGTAKPRRKTGSPRYHLIDVVRPDQPFTLAEYQRRALRAIRGILRRGKLPVLVGGTGLYVSAVIDNLEIPAVPPQEKLRAELGRKSVSELYALLASVDPISARRTGPHNARRMIRALEVLAIGGERFSAQLRKGPPLFDALAIGLAVPREALYRAIDRRVDRMMREGFMAEVLRLRKGLNSPELPAMSGIGYAELNAAIEGRMTLPEAVARIKFRTHQYARRQITWWKRDHRVKWLKRADSAIPVVRKWRM